MTQLATVLSLDNAGYVAKMVESGTATEREAKRMQRSLDFITATLKQNAGAAKALKDEVDATAAATRKFGDAVNARMQEMSGYAGIASKAFVALGGVLSTGALVAVVQSGIKAKAALLELSTQTGITVQALGALGKVGRLTSTPLEEVVGASNKLSLALVKQNEDSKGAAQAIQALGLNFNDFKKLSAEERLVAVARAMAGFEDDTGKTAAAMLLFGKSGATLLPFLRDLAQVQDLSSKQTLIAAQQAQTFERNLIKLKGAANAWKNDVIDAVLPTLVDLSDAFLETRKEADKLNLTGAALKTFFQTLAVLAANVQFVFEGVGREIGAIAAQLNLTPMEAMRGGWTAISDAVKADGVRARAELDALERRILGIGLGDSARDENYSHEGRGKGRPKLSIAEPPPKQAGGTKDYAAERIQQMQRETAKLREEQQQFEEFGKVLDKSSLALALFDVTQGKAVGSSFALRQQLIQAAIAEDAQARATREAQKAAEEYAAAEKKRIASSEALRVVLADQRGATAVQVQGLRDEAEQMGMTTLQRRIAVEQRKIELELTKELQKPHTAEDQTAMLAAASDRTRDITDALVDADAAMRSFAGGARRSWLAYTEAANDSGKATEQIVGGSLSRMEDALVNFAKTGKLSLGSLFSFMAEEFLRQQARMLIAQAGTSVAASAPGLVSTLISAGASFFGFSHATGLDRVPYDGYPAILHEGERVQTAVEARGQQSGQVIHIGEGQTINVGQGVNMAQVSQAVAQGNAQTIALINRRGRQGL